MGSRAKEKAGGRKAPSSASNNLPPLATGPGSPQPKGPPTLSKVQLPPAADLETAFRVVVFSPGLYSLDDGHALTAPKWPPATLVRFPACRIPCIPSFSWPLNPHGVASPLILLSRHASRH